MAFYMMMLTGVGFLFGGYGLWANLQAGDMPWAGIAGLGIFGNSLLFFYWVTQWMN